MTRDTLEQLRAAQLQHLSQWLQSEPAREAWRQRAQQHLEAMRAQPLGDLVDVAALHRSIDTALDAPATRLLFRPAARAVLQLVSARANQRSDRPVELLSKETRALIEATTARPEVMNEPLLRAVIEDPAVESVMGDLLFNALDEFNRTVNPFFADWGLPALLSHVPLFGKGAIKKALDNIRRDFDKRLEPEIKKFVKSFARRALDRSIKQMLDRSSDPELVALRKRVAATLLEQPISELSWPTDSEHGQLALDTAAAALADLVLHDSTRVELHAAVDELLSRHGQDTVGTWLDLLGVGELDLTPMLDTAWPALRSALSGDAMMQQLSALIDEAHEAWLASQQIEDSNDRR